MSDDDRNKGYDDGKRDTVDKCIRLIELLHDNDAMDAAQKDALWQAICALRALQEK